jgi:putative transposase
MTRRKIIENENFGSAIDISSWPNVLVDNLSEEDRNTYYNRRKAVEMYFQNKTHDEIKEATGIHRNIVTKFVKRCLETDSESVIWGFRALIPRKRISSYKRDALPESKPSDPDPNKNGAFMLLLETYSDLKDEIHRLYFKQKNRSASDPVIKTKYIHKQFIQKCRDLGLKAPKDYPFNTAEMGRRSLYNYIDKLEEQHISRASERYGKDASQLIRSTGAGDNYRQIVRPFEQVQFDGHKIDLSIALILYTPEGDEIITVIDRIWLLAIIDVATRATLGYHVSYNKEYNASDVLHCIRNSIVPWKPRELTIPGLTYPENAGFPSGIVPEAAWALWDEILYDQAKANLSNIVKDRLKQVVKCRVNPGKVSCPIKRSHIERLFGLLEENGFHRFPNTTGSHPKDPRRNEPEKKAIKFRVTAQQLEELIDVLIADYNATPHEGVNYATPLDAMKQRLQRFTVNQMPEEQRNEVAFLSLKAEREIKGDVRVGRRPYIQYENVRYTNELLAKSPGLIKKKVDLIVNVDDLRVIRAYLPDGSELGKLKAMGKWGLTPHTLQVRKEIFKLKRLKLFHFTTSDDPVKVYQRFLEEGAKTKKRSASKAYEMERNQN